MSSAQIILYLAMLGSMSQAGAETPYQHEYLNGGYFDGVPDARNAAERGDNGTGDGGTAHAKNNSDAEPHVQTSKQSRGIAISVEKTAMPN
ncbi:MAG: hypothetical protein M0Z99_33655 [Betaproteobacteria bacterium]|nr:hypothetical protein [Betaproteobacteria bacterium]